MIYSKFLIMLKGYQNPDFFFFFFEEWNKLKSIDLQQKPLSDQ